ncbi:PREDICTED: N-acetylated-alpha-linked acidic dipeptidase-like protein, partial [Myotis davidii]
NLSKHCSGSPQFINVVSEFPSFLRLTWVGIILPVEDRSGLASQPEHRCASSSPSPEHSLLLLPLLQAVNAAKHKVAGVLVYTDPADVNDGRSLPNETFPHSWHLPPSGVERGSYYEYFGDPLTPYLPANPSSFRLDPATASGFPPIPIQPIGFEDAKVLLCNLQGPSAQADWQGALGCDYKLGPGFEPGGMFAGRAVNAAKHKVAGVLVYTDPADVNDGRSLPNETFPHSWPLPPSGPIGFEDAKVLLCNLQGPSAQADWQGALGCDYKLGPGFEPGDSRVFASWGAEEFGLIGSTEFTEEFFCKLQERAVAYINVDISVFANATLRAQGTPPVQSVIFSAAKQIPAPGPGSLSIYDNWIRYFNRSSPVYGLVPSVGSLGAGSDYAPFIHFLGISSMDIAYTYDRSKTSARIYPTYHTAFDTFGYVDTFVDPGFSSHQAVARTAGNVLLRLSDSLFLPLNVSDYSETLRSFLQAAQLYLGPLLERHSISLDTKMLAAPMLPISPGSHVLWAPRKSVVATFPGLANAFLRANDTDPGSAAWAEVQRQLSIVVVALEGAAATLRPVADL